MKKFLVLSLLFFLVILSACSKDSFRISFETNGGTAIPDITSFEDFEEGLPVTTREGYSFEGWFTDTELTEPFSENSVPTDLEITLYAKWEALVEVTVTYVTNSSSTIPSETVYSGETVSRPTDPVKEGYTFENWFIGLSTTPYVFNAPVTANITLEARYIPALVDYEVEVYKESLTHEYALYVTWIHEAYTESTVNYNTAIPGFTLNTSHPNSDLSGTALADGSLLLKAYYTRNNYTIYFESNADLSITSMTGLYESSITAPSIPLRSGYTFIGWYSDEALTTPYVFSTMPAYDMTLYAKWLGNDTNLYFNSNGGTLIPMLTAPLGSSITPPANPTQDGYTFAGWYEDPLLNTPFTSWVMPSGGQTLYAKWTPRLYTITYETFGGTLVPPVSVLYMDTFVLPSAPVKTDFVFNGWFTDASLINPYVPGLMPASNFTLYAKWISEADALLINNLIHNEMGQEVTVKGMVFLTLVSGYTGYYIYDDSGYLFILGDQSLVFPGFLVELEGTLSLVNGVPTLVSITESTVLSTSNLLTYSLNSSIEEINQMEPSIDTYNKAYTVSGVLVERFGYFYLVDMLTGEEIQLSERFYNPGELDSLIHHKLQVSVILSRYTNQWLGGLAFYQDLNYTDDIKADDIETWLRSMIDPIYYSNQMFTLPLTDPFHGSTIAFQSKGENASSYDTLNQKFLPTTSSKVVQFTADILFGTTHYPFDFEITLEAIVITSIEDFYSYDEGVYTLEALVVYKDTNLDFTIIKDDTASIYLFGWFEFHVGDLIQIRASKSLLDEKMEMIYFDDIESIIILSSLNPLNHTATVLSEADVVALNPNEPDTYARYVEIKGYLSMFGGDNENFIISTDLFTLPILSLSYGTDYKLLPYTGYEVIIRGYLIENHDGAFSLCYTGIPFELSVPNYMDQERIDAILNVFADKYASVTFHSFDTFLMNPYDAILGGTITYEFLNESASIYDEDTQTFKFVDEETPFSLELTISSGELSLTYTFQTTVLPPDYVTIAEMKTLEDDTLVFIKGLVIYRDRDFAYVQDETGIIKVEQYDMSFYKGDEVVLYGEKQSDYYGVGQVTLYEIDRNVSLLVAIVSRDNPVVIESENLIINELNQMDPEDSNNYSRYVSISGYLNLTYGGLENYMTLSQGDDEVRIIPTDEYTYYKLAQKLDSFVTLYGYIDGYHYTETWEILYTGMTNEVEPKSYSDIEKLALVKQFVENQFEGSFEEFQTIMIYTTHPTLGGIISMSVSPTDEAIFNPITGAIGLVDAVTHVNVTVTVEITETVNETFVIDMVIVPAEDEITLTPISIADFKLSNGETRAISAKVIAIMPYQDYFGLILEDSTGIIFMPTEYYFYEYSLVGQTVQVEGTYNNENGRAEIISDDYTITNYGSAAKTFVPTTVSQLNALDSLTTTMYGAPVQVTGTLMSYQYGTYILLDGQDMILVSAIYYGADLLERHVGYEVTLNAFYAGYASSESLMEITLTTYNYGMGANLTLGAYTDEVKVNRIADQLIDQLYDESYNPGDYLYLNTYHYLFTSAIITYEVTSGMDYAYISGSSMSFSLAPTDQVITVQMTVTLNAATTTRTFEVLLNGYATGTLDDLFALTPEMDEIALSAFVLYASRHYGYYLVGDEVYYLEKYTYNQYDPYTEVLITGLKRTIDGSSNYTYEIEIIPISEPDPFVLTSRPMTIAQVYEANLAVDDIRRDYIELYGKFGYDIYLDMFFIEEMDERIYIRDHASRRTEEYYLFWSSDDGILRSEIMDYVDAYVYIDVCYPNLFVRNDMIMVEFIGDESNIRLPEMTPQELLQLTKERAIAKLLDITATGGDYLRYLVPDHDPLFSVYFSYELVNPLNSNLINMDDYGMQVMPVSTETVTEVRLNLEYYDSSTMTTYTDAYIFEVTILPMEMETIREVLWGTLYEYHYTTGVVQYIHDDEFMIVKDSSGTIYVEIYDCLDRFGFMPDEGDLIKFAGEKYTYENEHFVPIMDDVFYMELLSSNHTVERNPITMTVQDILAIDHLNPDSFNQYISFTGIVIFTGGYSYPSYDLREEGYLVSEYNLQMWADTYQPYLDMMGPLVGDKMTAEGYLIGFEYIYCEFDWILMYTEHVMITN
jgi:uncharacterized repeat protein (TIGR02543 family)